MVGEDEEEKGNKEEGEEELEGRVLSLAKSPPSSGFLLSNSCIRDGRMLSFRW